MFNLKYKNNQETILDELFETIQVLSNDTQKMRK